MTTSAISTPVSLRSFTDAAADSVARAIAAVQKDAARERELREAEHRARLAELETRLLSVAGLERQLTERLAALKDGDPGPPGRDGEAPDPEVVADLVRDSVKAEVAQLPPPARGADGRDADIDLVREVVAEVVSETVAALPAPASGKDGRDGRDVEDIEVVQDGADLSLAFTVGDVRSVFEIELPAGPAGEPGAEGAPGKLPIVKAWSDQVHYEGDVVTHDGATFQALCDTGRTPPSDDWAMLAAAGADGRDAREYDICGTYDAEQTYQRLNVVALNGASFVAKVDDPGPCPGDGWQLMAAQGKRGTQGERGLPGPRGDRGAPGPPVVAVTIDGEGLLTLLNGDGSTVFCDLYPVLSKLGR